MSASEKVSLLPEVPLLRPVPARATEPQYHAALGYLRAFITVLVVAPHAALAYHPFAPPAPSNMVVQPRLWAAFPVVDSARWNGFGLLVGFNDTFFMSLMFFLSGLFVWKTLQRKGVQSFLSDRAVRLGIPFAVAVLIAPLAYYPAYLTTGSHSGLTDFWRQWLSLGNWPVGPAWFIWVLLVFDFVAGALFLCYPNGARSWAGCLRARIAVRFCFSDLWSQSPRSPTSQWRWCLLRSTGLPLVRFSSKPAAYSTILFISFS